MKTCNEEFNVIFSFFYVTPIFLCAGTALTSLFFIAKVAWILFRRVFWHKNIKVLLYTTIIACFFLALTSIFGFGTFLEKWISNTDACKIIIPLSQCTSIRILFLMSFLFMSFMPYAMLIERSWATYTVARYEKSIPWLSVVLLISMISISGGVSFYIMSDEDGYELQPQCLAFSASKLGNKFYFVFKWLCGAEIVVLVLQVLLFWHNRKLKKSGASAEFSSRYQITENLAVLNQLIPLSATCSILILGYTICALIMRIFREDMSNGSYMLVTFYIFIIPHLCFILPLVILYMLEENIKHRTKKNQVALFPTPERSYDPKSLQWEQQFNERHPQMAQARPLEDPISLSVISGNAVA